MSDKECHYPTEDPPAKPESEGGRSASPCSSRLAFENWFEADSMPFEHSNWFGLDEDEDYQIDAVDRSWDAWEAATKWVQNLVLSAKPDYHGMTPQTDAVIADDDGGNGYIANLARNGRMLERERDALLDFFRKNAKVLASDEGGLPATSCSLPNVPKTLNAENE